MDSADVTLLFLRSDITDPEVLDLWVQADRRGRIRLLAYVAERLAGYGTLTRRYVSWMRHICEIRVLVAPPLRGADRASRLLENNHGETTRSLPHHPRRQLSVLRATV